MGRITLLVGGARSGKSALAVEIGRRFCGDVVFVATAEAFDDDMRSRIARHRADRPPWPTVEAPRDLSRAVAGSPGDALLIIDCLTVWLGNLTHDDDEAGSAHVAGDVARLLIAVLVARPGPSVVVSNEVGMGVHPETDLGRRYRDELGRVNQAFAAAASTTLLLVAGRALRLEDPWKMLEAMP